MAAIPAPAGGGDHADPVADRGCRARRSGPAQPGHQRVARESKQRSSLETARSGLSQATTLVAGGDSTDAASSVVLVDRIAVQLAQGAGRPSLFEVLLLGLSPGCRSAGAGSRSPPSRRSCRTRSPPRTGSPGRIPRCATPTVAFLPGLVVRAPLAVPGGSYELYYLFPLTQEEETLGLVSTLAVAGLFLVVLLGAIAWIDPSNWWIRCGWLPHRRAVLRWPARGTDAEWTARTTSPSWRPRSSLDGQLAAEADPSAGGSLGAAPVRVRRLARAAHPADHRAHGRRRAARVPRGLRPGRVPVGRTLFRTSSTASRACSPTCSRSVASTPAPRCSSPNPSTSVTSLGARSQLLSPWPSARAARWSCGCPTPRTLAEELTTLRRVERVLRNLVVNAVEHGEGRRSRYGWTPQRTRSRSQSATTARDYDQERPRWSSTSSGGRIPRGPAPPAAPTWASQSLRGRQAARRLAGQGQPGDEANFDDPAPHGSGRDDVLATAAGAGRPRAPVGRCRSVRRSGERAREEVRCSDAAARCRGRRRPPQC